MHRLNSSFILGYHGCSAHVAEQLLSGAMQFKASDNDYDWLGPGIYFWQSNPLRALQFAREKRKRERATWKPAVVGAAIDLGNCLDLTTEVGIEEVRLSHQLLVDTYKAADLQLPSNSGGAEMLLRPLDCAVVRQLHDIRDSMSRDPVDTVKGIFVEGEPIYEGSGFRSKTHVQVAVCNPAVIRGIFRVPATDLAPVK